MGKAIDLENKTFGKLKVISRASNNKHNHARWNCLCECGNNHIVTSYCLRLGQTRSCGCSTYKFSSEKLTKHGMRHTKIYEVWKDMRHRCNSKKHKQYKNYGGRGITVCKEWNDSFESFWLDMKANYKEGLSIDRINNDKGYYKENCRWTTNIIQANNKRKIIKSNTGVIGVYKTKHNSYAAQINIGGNRINLRSHKKIEDAILARKDAEKKAKKFIEKELLKNGW